jgi:hypothetical protein
MYNDKMYSHHNSVRISQSFGLSDLPGKTPRLSWGMDFNWGNPKN